MVLFNPDGDRAFCSSDEELLHKFDASPWWTPLFIIFFVCCFVLTVCLVFCRIYFRKYKKGSLNFLGTLLCTSSCLTTVYCYLAMPAPLLTPQESTRIFMMWLIYSGVVALMNTVGLLAVHQVQQISSFDVSLKMDIPQLKMLRRVQLVFGIFPPFLAPGVILVYGFNQCRIAGNYLRILAAFIAVPQVTTAISWVVFGTLAYIALTRQTRLETNAASGQVWNQKLKQIRVKVLATGLISGVINALGFIPNAFAAYTFLLDESFAFHCFIRILGVVFMIVPFANHLIVVYGSNFAIIRKRSKGIHPMFQENRTQPVEITKGVTRRTEMSTRQEDNPRAKEKVEAN